MSATSILFKWPALNEAQMMQLGARLAHSLEIGDVLALKGDLGSGKTTLARAMIQAVSPAPVDVTSPTFTLMQEYPVTLESGPAEVLHCDLYRLESAQDVHAIGLLEMLHDHVTLIEWPQIIAHLLPQDTLYIECAAIGDKNTRQLSLSGSARWKQRLTFLQETHPL